MARTTPPTQVRAPRTVVGSLDAARHAGVDAAGRVRLDGADWALEWWIGAEDRWHDPAQEASVRQRLVSGTPVVETRLRVPSGDAVQRAYGARDASGAAVIVVELENDSKVPFAVALAVRAADPDGSGRVDEVTAEGTEVRIDGRLALVAARAPGRRAAVTSEGDIAALVQGGEAQPAAAVAARCPSGRAQGAVVFPLAHAATLRVVLPLEPGPLDVQALPTAAQVASGWRTHARRGARVVLPDRRLQDAFDSNVCHLLLRPHGFPVAAALSRMGFTAEAAAALLADPVATAGADGPGEALLALAAHWSLTRDEDFADQAVPLVASLVAKLGKTGTPEELRLGAIAANGAASLLSSVGQARGAEDVRRAGAAMAKASSAPMPPPAPVGVEPLLEALSTASSTWTWKSTRDGHDLIVGAALLVGVRNLFVAEAPSGALALELSAHVHESWLGQGWECHDLPTGSGRLSYAVRWHGDRPALLWELQGWPGAKPVTLTIPGLDRSWSSTEPTGEALLAPVPIPERPVAAVTTPVELGRKPQEDVG